MRYTVQELVKQSQEFTDQLPDFASQQDEALNPLDVSTLANYFDHTLLKPTIKRNEIEQLCTEAQEYGFATVCVPPSYIPLCTNILNASSVLPITVVGFPFGYEATDTKVFETKTYIRYGAEEIDMVINSSAFQSEDYHIVQGDIRKVVQAAKDVPVKVIVETAYLSLFQKVLIYGMIRNAQAAFIKTSTGFAETGAQLEDIRLFRHLNQSQWLADLNPLHIKASGGIRTKVDALAMIQAGSDRIGASASVSIIRNN
jgi:deoxyribose-phosphate aldolase